MQAQIGEYKKAAVILDSAEADFIDALRTARGLGPTDPITYKTDDEVAGFEIYRTETKPSTYDDFAGQFRNSISTFHEGTASEFIYAWGTAYIDEIVPNKTYYYMVRTVDPHGQKSYPSSVFKVQMVNDSGAIYPLIEAFDLKPPPEPQTNTKSFKKFLHLIPAVAQKMVNYEESGLIVDGKLVSSADQGGKPIILGEATPRLFGNDPNTTDKLEKFKIRLISKQTGKKIDLNVAFKVENEL
jgi:hypothetical protein